MLRIAIETIGSGRVFVANAEATASMKRIFSGKFPGRLGTNNPSTRTTLPTHSSGLMIRRCPSASHCAQTSRSFLTSLGGLSSRVTGSSKKPRAPRPNIRERVVLAAIQHDDILKSCAVEAASSEPDRKARDDLLLIPRLQRVEAGSCEGLEANVLKAPPARRKQTQRVKGAKRRGKYGCKDSWTSDLKTTPSGAPQ